MIAMVLLANIFSIDLAQNKMMELLVTKGCKLAYNRACRSMYLKYKCS